MSRSTKANKKRGGVASRIIFWLALLVFVVCLGILGFIGWGYLNGAKTYDDLEKYTEFNDQIGDLGIDWDSLKEINSDIVGWVYVPDSDINYPICWREGDDQYYLDHDFNGQYSTGLEPTFGSIFLSGSNKRDFSDNSIFIFGHNMLLTGKMFSPFSDNQGNDEWFNSHRTIYVLTEENTFTLETFAQIKVAGTADDVVYTSFGTTAQLKEYVQRVLGESIVHPNNEIDVNSIDRIFAFSTCSKPDTDNRIITYARVKSY